MPFWYSNSKLAWLLLPFSLLFWLISQIRGALFSLNILSSYKSPKPVIIVGNLSVGGNGKTPVVVWLVEELQKQGLRVGVISRGYGSQSKTYPLLVTPETDPVQGGDEPVLIVKRTGVPVVISPNRQQAIELLLKTQDCDLIISDDVYNAVIRYLDGRIWGLFFSFPFLALRSFLVGITQTKALNMAAFTAVLVNIPMNWLLIFGFDMGISGAAIASSFAELCSLIVLTVYMFRHINRHLYGLHWSIDITVLKEVFSISVWSMFQFFMSVAIWFLFFLAIERLSETELAVSNIIRSVSALFAVIVNALSGVTSSLVSNLIGAGEKRNVFPLCHRIIRLGYAAGVPLIVLALLFHQSIIGAYTDNPIIIQVAWLPFAVMLLNYFFALPGYVYLNAVTGTGATRTVFIFQVITTIAYLFCLWGLSHWNVPLAAYWTVEYLFVILLGCLLYTSPSPRDTR